MKFTISPSMKEWGMNLIMIVKMIIKEKGV